MNQNKQAPRRRMTRREWKIRRRLRLARNWAVFLTLCGLAIALMTRGILWLLPRVHALIAGPAAFEAQIYDGIGYEADLSDPRLVLVNGNLPLEEEPVPTLAAADDATGQQLEEEAAEQYRKMAEAAAGDGITLTLITGYQDEEARTSAYEAQKQAYLEKGFSEEEASSRAGSILPRPEASEHAIGYGADILDPDTPEKTTAFAETRTYEWLTAYAAEYGFILRWPKEHQAATGMVFEPWHWRYVGRENALAIRASELSLEEFLALERAKE